MFTGIVEDKGKIIAISRGKNIRIKIQTKLNEIKVSDSVSVEGICLTVTEKTTHTFTVEAIKETAKRTTLKIWKTGDYVNLERAMIMNGRLDGHILLGHVDSIGKITKIERKEGEFIYTIKFDKQFKKYVVPKGSIGINGVSLTIGEMEDNTIKVHIIPYSYENTTFKKLKKGDQVNIEFDIIGKYIVTSLEKRI